MPDSAVLVRDRKNLDITQVRTRGDHGEPVKLRVCRTCGRVHAEDSTSCEAV